MFRAALSHLHSEISRGVRQFLLGLWTLTESLHSADTAAQEAGKETDENFYLLEFLS